MMIQTGKPRSPVESRDDDDDDDGRRGGATVTCEYPP